MEFLLSFLLSCFISDMVCLHRFFIVFFFCSFLVICFINLSWKKFNLIILIYRVELYLKNFSYSCFLFLFGSWGGVGALAFMKKTGV